MKLTKQLANRLSEVLLDGSWVTGTNIKDQIIELDWKEATAKVKSLNTIADLIFHIDYYIAGVLKVLEGGPLEIKDKFSFDVPPVKSNKDWRNLVDKFCSDSEKFIHLIQHMPEKKLESPFADEKYGNFHRNIDVMIEHCYYHLGQIILIKKLVQKET